MRNIKLTIIYDGKNYCGWQIQKNGISVQQVIQNILKDILRENVKLKAAGRTDSGVHARGQVANFKTVSKVPRGQILKALNGLLPEDIAVKNVSLAPPDFDAQFSAKSKIYRYSIYNSKIKDPFRSNSSVLIPYDLDLGLMKKAASYMIGKKDFSCFRSSNSPTKTSVRTIKDIKIRKKGREINIYIEADGFLYNMVRIIVGTLLEVGKHKIEPEIISGIISSRKRANAGPTAPAKGLTLLRVKY